MALNANKSKNVGGDSTPITPVEPGTYPARLALVVDMGLQNQRPFQGQDKPPAYEITVTYEFVDEFLKDEDGNDIEDKPRWISETFPLYSLDSEKAKSTKRYLALDPQRVNGGDWSKLLSAPCLVTVVNNESKGKVYTNVAGIAAMRSKDAEKCPPLVNEAAFFDLDDPDVESFGKLPKWMQERIKGNLEYPGSKLEKLLKDAPEKESSSEYEDVPVDNSDDEEDNPY